MRAIHYSMFECICSGFYLHELFILVEISKPKYSVEFSTQNFSVEFSTQKKVVQIWNAFILVCVFYIMVTNYKSISIIMVSSGICKNTVLLVASQCKMCIENSRCPTDHVIVELWNLWLKIQKSHMLVS